MKAYDLLSNPEAWIKVHIATDANGTPVHESDATARKWCAYGAVLHCYRNGEASAFTKTHGENPVTILENAVGGAIGPWNDAPERTHVEVVTKLKELDI